MKSTLPKLTPIFDRHHRASESKAGSIELRITYEGIQKYIGTGIHIYPYQWRKGEIVNRADSLQLTQILDSLISDIRQVILDMAKDKNIDISLIPERLKRAKAGRISFMEFCRQRSIIRKYGKKEDTKQRYDRFMKFFQDWGMVYSFEDINEKNIINYDNYLKKKGLKPYSKWNNYHRFLNSFIMDAIDEGLIAKNPYKWVNIDRGDKISKEERYLSPEEFEKIKVSKMPTKSLEKIRDIFVFQTYTCLSYSDLKQFDSNKISEINGMKVYVDNRKKTGERFVIPLMDGALNILDKYNCSLPVISNVNYNLGLKAIAQIAGIDKPVSSHWARHTGATLLLNKGVDMKIVSRICGHSSTRITEQIYAKILDETVVNAVKNIR